VEVKAGTFLDPFVFQCQGPMLSFL
jgi:hypothetical protein